MGTPARRERAEPGGDARGPISIGSRAPEPSGPDPLLLQMKQNAKVSSSGGPALLQM